MHHNMRDLQESQLNAPELPTKTLLVDEVELKCCVSSGTCSAHCSLVALCLTSWDCPLHLSLLVFNRFKGMPGQNLKLLFYHQNSVLQLLAASASLNPHLHNHNMARLGFPFHTLWFQGASKQKARIPSGGPTSVSFPRGFTVLPVVQCWKIIVSYILSVFLIVYCGRINLVYVSPSCQKEKSHLTFDY